MGFSRQVAVMQRAAHFLRLAKRAERLARRAPTAALRQEMLKVAREWRALAEEAGARAPDDPEEEQAPKGPGAESPRQSSDLPGALRPALP